MTAPRTTLLTDSADQYFVFTPDDGTYERDRADRTLANVIRDLADGQYGKPGRVLLVNVADHIASDATEDVAEAVRAFLLADGRKASETIRNWIEDALGAHSADCVTHELEYV